MEGTWALEGSVFSRAQTALSITCEKHICLLSATELGGYLSVTEA